MAMHYKNTQFCRENTCARFATQCEKALTNKIKQEAVLWWMDFMGNEDAPVAVLTSRPQCYEHI